MAFPMYPLDLGQLIWLVSQRQETSPNGISLPPPLLVMGMASLSPGAEGEGELPRTVHAVVKREWSPPGRGELPVHFAKAVLGSQCSDFAATRSHLGKAWALLSWPWGRPLLGLPSQWLHVSSNNVTSSITPTTLSNLDEIDSEIIGAEELSGRSKWPEMTSQ